MRTIIIPPVCVLPTLAGAKLYTASRALKSNIDCIPYNVSRKISKFKSSKKDKKENKEEQASSENKTETKKENVKTSESDNSSKDKEETVSMHIEFEKENEQKTMLDFSNAKDAVIIEDEQLKESEPELKEVTQEDLDKALEKMKTNSFKL